MLYIGFLLCIAVPSLHRCVKNKNRCHGFLVFMLLMTLPCNIYVSKTNYKKTL